MRRSGSGQVSDIETKMMIIRDAVVTKQNVARSLAIAGMQRFYSITGCTKVLVKLGMVRPATEERGLGLR